MSESPPRHPEANWEVPTYEVHEFSPRSRAHCVVIPVINEGARILRLLEAMRALQVHELADVIITDGGSVDGSMAPGGLQEGMVNTLLIKTGPGRLGSQLRCAYAFALERGYEGIVTIDGNGKDDPEAIPRFIEALEHGVAFVQASRFLPEGHSEHTPLLRELAIRLVHAPMLRLCSGFAWTDTTQGFRGYRRELLLDPRLAVFRHIFQNYELLFYLSYRAPRLGYRCQELPTTRRYPRKAAVPTKIVGIWANLKILSSLVKVCAGTYNPRPDL